MDDLTNKFKSGLKIGKKRPVNVVGDAQQQDRSQQRQSVSYQGLDFPTPPPLPSSGSSQVRQVPSAPAQLPPQLPPRPSRPDDRHLTHNPSTGETYYKHTSGQTYDFLGYPVVSTPDTATGPPLPPATTSSTRPERAPELAITSSYSSESSLIEQPTAGSLFPPGGYPTPELCYYPLSKTKVLLDLPPYTSTVIQEALDSLGPHSTLYLPRGTRWSVSSTLWLKPCQELATLGYPIGDDQVAWLDAEKGCTGHILSGANMPGVLIRNIGVDGGREKFGYSKDCDCMVHLGNSKGYNQQIDFCHLRHPRQWSCLQVFQGGENVRVTNNFIGPAGYDGAAEAGGHWADGISYAGQNGLVAGNSIIDATDGAIVIFGAPGTLVTCNTIVTRNRIGLGAINMVDYGPHDGNYLNTRVVHNTIRIEGSYLRIGIGQGGSVWFTPPPLHERRKYNRGATVMYNRISSGGVESRRLKGNKAVALGYGFAISDVEDWICTNNRVSHTVTIAGDMSRMSKDPRTLNIGPGAFVCSPSTNAQGPKDSELQADFVRGPIGRLIDIEPGQSGYRVFCPGQLDIGMGHNVMGSKVELAFDWDGEVRLRKVPGEVESHWKTWEDTELWRAGSSDAVGETTTARLVLDSNSGKLIITDSGITLFEISPTVPYQSDTDDTPRIGFPTPPTTRKGAEETVMVISDARPYLMLASTATGSIFWAPTGYHVGYQWEIRRGPFVAQTTADGKNTLLSMMNPFGQFVVLQTVSGRHVPEMPSWPLDESLWKVVWKSHEVKNDAEEDLNTKMIFQGDGNLVIYSGKNGRPLWASGTCGLNPPARHTVWGRGTEQDPYLACVTDEGAILWSTHGKRVG